MESTKGLDKSRAALVKRAGEELRGGERIVAMLPFATVPKFPGRTRRKDKVRLGVRQSWRRYRPTALTDRRLLVFDSRRTPFPRELVASFPIEDVHVLEVVPVGMFGQLRVMLELPGLGVVPFDTGRKERADVERFAEVLSPTA